MSEVKYEVQTINGRDYHQAYFMHQTEDGAVEKTFLGTITHEEDGWISGHAPWPQEHLVSREEVGRVLLASKLERDNSCPSCGSYNLTGVEYPELYDGVSEWICSRCGTRWDRFNGKIIEAGNSQQGLV